MRRKQADSPAYDNADQGAQSTANEEELWRSVHGISVR